MRTTLTLDDDLANALKQRAKLLDQSFKQVVNDTLRRGLSPKSRDQPTPPIRIRTFSSAYAPGVDRLRLSELADELEVEHFLEVQRRDSDESA